MEAMSSNRNIYALIITKKKNGSPMLFVPQIKLSETRGPLVLYCEESIRSIIAEIDRNGDKLESCSFDNKHDRYGVTYIDGSTKDIYTIDYDITTTYFIDKENG